MQWLQVSSRSLPVSIFLMLMTGMLLLPPFAAMLKSSLRST